LLYLGYRFFLDYNICPSKWVSWVYLFDAEF
jgi:hypothetical protein